MDVTIQKVITEALQKIVEESGCLVEYSTKYEPIYKKRNWLDTKDNNPEEQFTVTIKLTKKEQNEKEITQNQLIEISTKRNNNEIRKRNIYP